ncbi:4Fe-4S dicluster domain-containing protein, partial [Klebsiella pneumoniae]|nr:4Fe-4S dicluster domain-containing protein [Klebsiella pneumoniae]
RLDEGLQPRCVESCPAGVLRFGEIEDLRKEHTTQWTVLEKRYNLPDHNISKPNIVIIAPRD